MNNDIDIDIKEVDLLVKFLTVLLLESKRCEMEKDLFLSNNSQTDGGHIPIQILLWLLLRTWDKVLLKEVEECFLLHLEYLGGIEQV